MPENRRGKGEEGKRGRGEERKLHERGEYKSFVVKLIRGRKMSFRSTLQIYMSTREEEMKDRIKCK